jgi:hypothetical protein
MFRDPISPEADEQSSLLAAAALVSTAVIVSVVHVIRGKVLLQDRELLLPPFRRLGRFFRFFLVLRRRGASLAVQAEFAGSARELYVDSYSFLELTAVFLSRIKYR